MERPPHSPIPDQGASARTPYFRAGACIIVLNELGEVLVFERSDIAGSWQFPQGGLDPDEEPRDAAFRELFEETGIPASSVDIVAESRGWLFYEYPPDKRRWQNSLGQTHRWYVMRLRPDAAGPDLENAESDEFVNYRWTTMAEATAGVIGFRRPAYEEAGAEFTRLLA